MKLTILLTLLVHVLSDSWDDYLNKFPNANISFSSKSHFLENLKYIVQKQRTFKLGITPFTHLSFEEYSSKFYTFVDDRIKNYKTLSPSFKIPDSKDWVKDGCVTDVKDQAQCGSCWSFSTTGSVEGSYCAKNGKLISLSEQQLVSCANKLNQGCNGGNVDWTFRYLEKNELSSELDYPYVSGNGSVPECVPNKGAVPKIDSFVDVPKGNEEQLKIAVSLNPVSVAIDASSKEFQMYESGIMDFDCGTQLNHAVLIVSYGTENGVDYWTVKNSWSTKWGEGGYFRVVRNKNLCGISESASYPSFE